MEHEILNAETKKMLEVQTTELEENPMNWRPGLAKLARAAEELAREYPCHSSPPRPGYPVAVPQTPPPTSRPPIR